MLVGLVFKLSACLGATPLKILVEGDGLLADLRAARLAEFA